MPAPAPTSRLPTSSGAPTWERSQITSDTSGCWRRTSRTCRRSNCRHGWLPGRRSRTETGCWIDSVGVDLVDRGAAAAIGLDPAAEHAAAVERHRDVAVAIQRDRAAIAAGGRDDLVDDLVGRGLERGGA